MSDFFSIPVMYKNTGREYNAELRQLGYTHRIVVDLDGIELVLEPDEERNYRAMLPPDAVSKVDKGLVEAVMKALQEALK